MLCIRQINSIYWLMEPQKTTQGTVTLQKLWTQNLLETIKRQKPSKYHSILKKSIEKRSSALKLRNVGTRGLKSIKGTE